MKFTKPFKGATGGNPYPQDFKKGDDCPDDLLEAAKLAGAVAKSVKQKAPAKPTVVEKDNTWLVMRGEAQVGDPYETKEAAEAALAELGNE